MYTAQSQQVYGSMFTQTGSHLFSTFLERIDWPTGLPVNVEQKVESMSRTNNCPGPCTAKIVFHLSAYFLLPTPFSAG